MRDNNNRTYTHYSKTTNGSGVVTFTLPAGEYRFGRARTGSNSGAAQRTTVQSRVA